MRPITRLLVLVALVAITLPTLAFAAAPMEVGGIYDDVVSINVIVSVDIEAIDCLLVPEWAPAADGFSALADTLSVEGMATIVDARCADLLRRHERFRPNLQTVATWTNPSQNSIAVGGHSLSGGVGARAPC